MKQYRITSKDVMGTAPEDGDCVIDPSDPAYKLIKTSALGNQGMFTEFLAANIDAAKKEKKD